MTRKNQLTVYVSMFLLLVSSLPLLFVRTMAADYTIISTLTPTPIQIPLSQSPLDLEQLQKLMNVVNGCYLPCFWGFMPNYTPAKDIIKFVQPEKDFAKLKDYSIRYMFPPKETEEAKISVSFTISNQLLSNLEIILYSPSDWLPEKTFQLPYLLQQMSNVPDVYLSINNSQQRIFLSLVYVDEGVVIQYPLTLKVNSNIVSPNIENPYLLCPQLPIEDFIRIWLQSGNDLTLADQTIQPDAIPNHVWSPEQMTGLSTEAFIQQIINHPTECINMLSYPELAKQGYEF